MRVTLVISSLARGGAERILSLLANAWAQQGKQVTLLTLDAGDAPAYPLHPAIQLRHLALSGLSSNLVQGLVRNLRRIRVLRRAIRESRPDVVISFMDTVNVLTLVATRRVEVPVVVCELIDPSAYDIGPVWDGLRKRTYASADALVCLTHSALEYFLAKIDVKGYVIPPLFEVTPQQSSASSQPAKPQGHTLIAMGRLVPQKGFDLLLSAFARIAHEHPDWSLTVMGEGPFRRQLESQAAELKLGARVRFPGEMTDPFPLLRAADLFAFSSRFEGFGLALAEAMACGLPVVSFDCPSGPRDMVRDGIDGILVAPENVDAFAAALDRLMRNPEERSRIAAHAPEIITRFSKERILALWEELFESLPLSRQ